MEVFMYKTILVPLDGSTRAESILSHVENLSLLLKSKVIFLQVWTVHEAIRHAEDYILDYEKKKEIFSKYLGSIQEGFQKKGIESICFVEMGDAVETIMSVAQRENADLIAIASHGRSGLSRVFYGSVAAGIMQRIDRPMLIIRTRNI